MAELISALLARVIKIVITHQSIKSIPLLPNNFICHNKKKIRNILI